MWYILDTALGLAYLLVASLIMVCNCYFTTFVEKVRGRMRRRQYRGQCKDCIIIFSRYPEAGTTKTRLIPTLGPQGAAYCQLLMTDHILDTVSKYVAESLCELEVQYKGGTPSDVDYWLDRQQGRIPGLVWREQAEGDLGNKLTKAVLRKFSQGRDNVVVIGGDIPGITKKELTEAFTKLRSDNDMVIGPAKDGGYYLVGFKNISKRYMKSIFNDMEWGTSEVFRQQCDNAKKCGANLGVLSTTLSDVDTSSDLQVFEKEVGVRTADVTEGTWSIIIPVLNEGQGIRKTLDTILKNCSSVSSLKEILVCDGGSDDDTCEVVKEFGRTSPVAVRIIYSAPGRGFQLKAGGYEARSEYLLFLHADTILSPDYNMAAFQCLNKPGVVAGAFQFGLDLVHTNDVSSEDRALRTKLKWLESCVFWRSGLPAELPFGDQGLFLRRVDYIKSGGYPEVYLMEDVIMVTKLKQYGHVGTADCGPALTSARRWKKWGFVKITFTNHFIISCWKFGIHPNTMAKWYYGKKLKTQ